MVSARQIYFFLAILIKSSASISPMANETITSITDTAQVLFNKAAVAIVILIVGLAIGLLLKKITFRIFRQIELNKIMSNVGVTYDLEKGVSSILSYVVYLFTLLLFLEQLEIKSIVLYLAAGGLLLLVILTVIVGLKDVIPNFIGWIYVQRKPSFKEGYHIELPEISGLIEHIGYLETEIKTEKGDVLYVPNSLFLKSKHRIKK